jgi:predicted transcriptional regulator
MRLDEVTTILEGQILAGGRQGGMEIDRAYAVDLLSDVLALTDERTTLITGNVSPQVIRVAEILNVIAIIFIRGKQPMESTVTYAETLGIPVVATKKTMFETCGLLYARGVRPCKNRPMANPSD